jgi:5-methylcytosine-specific restriction protein B
VLAVPKDYTQYLFNGETYGKNRLVLAVVRAYIQEHQPTIQALRETFPKELQGSFGVFYTEQEFNARKQKSNDITKRFFTNSADRLTTEGEHIYVCNEWGLDNTTKFVEHSITLGFDIKVDSQAPSDEEIIQHFVHKDAFKLNYKNWPTEILSSFCELMRFANQTGLDIFIVNMKSGGAIRIGRKGHDHQKAREVFATFEPCQGKINFSQRSQHEDNRLKGELNTDSFDRMKASGDLQGFNQEHPISRNPYWPSDYQVDNTYANNTRIWKVSHSPSVLDAQQLEWLSDNELLAIHKDTGNGSVPCFKQMSEGDVVSLGYGGQVVRLVQVTSGIETNPDSPLGDEWLLRSYDTIKGLDKPVKYKGEHKRWSPRFNGTSWEVPTNEYSMFEQEILVPYYDLTLKDLGLETIQISKIEGVKSNMNEHQKATMNQILYGPPGTGKTYRTVQIAVDAAEPNFVAYGDTRDQLRKTYKAKYDALVADGRIRFVTFHQSYGYEEFVEGLSAKTEGDQLSYFEKDGVFKVICDDAKAFRVASKATITSKFDERWQQFAETLAESETGTQVKTLSQKTYFTVTDASNNTIRFDKSKGDSVHTLSVKTLKAIYNKEKVIKGGLQPYYGALIEHLDKIVVSSSDTSVERKHFVLIIDEINRGNISKIFGELITLIEPSKRLGEPESLQVVLPYSGDPFSVPDNLFIIGTMNTADRSLALMDTALRRRFDFVEMMPDYSVLFDDKGMPYNIVQNETSISIVQLLQTLNKRIAALYDREHTLGHAFLMPVIEKIKVDDHQNALAELSRCFKNKIIPLLAEYFFEDWQKIRLVLGDNQKESLNLAPLVEKLDVEFENLFGDTDDLELIDDEVYDYRLISSDSSLWYDPLTYKRMYDLSQPVE